jgi:2-polyprenyl-3-methyl-5-hydroxy-6-metoxy-1,4-benzoquinol methylase
MKKDIVLKKNKEVSLKYSKSSSFYQKGKKDYFLENDKLLDDALKRNELYTKQPERILCKICKNPLDKKADFNSHGVDYIFCNMCSHLNGKFEDTSEFTEKIYISNDAGEYSLNYLDLNFDQRVSEIYMPKVEFLIDSIYKNKFKILDVGCGSGYFVCAALEKNLNATGLDVNKKMVDFGNNIMLRKFNSQPLTLVDELGFFDLVKNSKADIISAIGVIEHLREPQKLFDAFKRSKAQFIYYSVPMFSFSSALENIFPKVYPRQLSGGHTHLFTENSISKMHKIIEVESIAEWRFGTDAMDLYRHVKTMLEKNYSSQKLIDLIDKGIGKNLDEIQSIFDKNHFCSEIHCIARKLK